MTDKKDGMSVNEEGHKGGEVTSASHDKRALPRDRQQRQPKQWRQLYNDREKASEAGRKGGEYSHGGGRNS